MSASSSNSAPQYRHDSDDLLIVQIIYGVAFTMGMIHLFDQLIKASEPTILLCATVIATSLLGLRFFFAVEELSQYLIFRRTKWHCSD